MDCLSIREFVEKFAEKPLQIMDFLGNNLMENLDDIIKNDQLFF